MKQSDKVIPRPKELTICENDALVFCTTMPGIVVDHIRCPAIENLFALLHFFTGAVKEWYVSLQN